MSVLGFLCGVVAPGVMKCFVLLTGDDNDQYPLRPLTDLPLPCGDAFRDTDRDRAKGK